MGRTSSCATTSSSTRSSTRSSSRGSPTTGCGSSTGTAGGTVADGPDLGAPLMRFTTDRTSTSLLRSGTVSLVLFGYSAGHVLVVAAAERPGGRSRRLFERFRELLPTPNPEDDARSAGHLLDVRPGGAAAVVAVDRRSRVGTRSRRTTRDEHARTAGPRSCAASGRRTAGSSSCGTGRPAPGRRSPCARSRGSGATGASFSYIVDPDAFFGQRADYLMSVLLEDGDGMMMMQEGRPPDDADGLDGGRPREIVLDDESEAEGGRREPPWRGARARGRGRADPGGRARRPPARASPGS